MKYSRKLVLSLATLITCLHLVLFPILARTQELSNPLRDPNQHNLQQAVYEHILADFQRDGMSLVGTTVEITPTAQTQGWAIATWMVVGESYPEGIAGQLLFKKVGQRWQYVNGGGGSIQDVNTLIEFGVPRREAQALTKQ